MLLLLPIAFISGALTVFSPCVLPILPIVLSSGIDGKIARVRGIIIGLVTSFTIVSLLLASVVQVLGVPADMIRNIAVGLLLIFGVTMLLPSAWGKILAFIEKNWRVQPFRSENDGFWGGFITGISLGVVWTPCIGPVLAAVATLAAINALSISSAFIVLSFSLGTALPLYFIARGGAKASKKLGFVKKNNAQIRQVFGAIIILTGLMIGFGYEKKFQEWTLNNLPESWTQIATTFEGRFNTRNQIDDLIRTDNKSMNNTKINNVSLQNDFNGAKISKSELITVLGKDGIPSIDTPVFESVDEANTWLEDIDRVFTVNYKNIKRAYPQRILNWHEIVNDEIAGDPVVVTFCPLCGSALAFERKVDGVVTEFGVSGKLHYNDLVMYDRYEGNLWQQITGEAIVGPAARRNENLKNIPISATTWSEWKSEHPDTLVLARDTGKPKAVYNNYPYGTYEQNDELLFGIKDLNKSLQIKTPVYGVEIDGSAKAYPETVFENNAEFIDKVGEVKVHLETQADGDILITRTDTGEEVVPVRLFWFAWAAFHPDTKIYRK